MIEPLLSGITFGLALAFMLGPVFFSLLQTSMQEGMRPGVYLATGVISSDMMLIGICYAFTSQVHFMNQHEELMGIIGGSVLCAFGLFQLLKRTRVEEVSDRRKAVHAKYLLKGFLLNTLNPMVLLFWLSVVGIVSLRKEYDYGDVITFFVSVIFTVYSTDLLKVAGAGRLKRFLNEKVIRRINLITGGILIAFGSEMIIRMLFFR